MKIRKLKWYKQTVDPNTLSLTVDKRCEIIPKDFDPPIYHLLEFENRAYLGKYEHELGEDLIVELNKLGTSIPNLKGPLLDLIYNIFIGNIFSQDIIKL